MSPADRRRFDGVGGPYKLLVFLKRVLRRLAGRPTPATAITVHPFDSLHGVDTSGLLERQHLQSGHPNDASITAYFGVPPSRFLNALEQWRATPGTLPAEAYRFIDVGCGKGRALLLASTFGFRDVTGVELNARLAAIAQSNLRHWKLAKHTTPVSVVCADAPAALPRLLDGPMLLYLYNPFEAPVLRQLLRALHDQQEQLTGPVDLLYLYPLHDGVFQEFPLFQQLWHHEIALAPEDADDGISAATDPCTLYRLEPITLYLALGKYDRQMLPLLRQIGYD